MLSLETSLTPKGLRQSIQNIFTITSGLETSLTPKGLRQCFEDVSLRATRLETSLTPKGLRPVFWLRVPMVILFRNFPDSKGIKTKNFSTLAQPHQV